MSPVSPVFHTVGTVSIGLKNVLRMIFFIEYLDIRIKHFNSLPSYFRWGKLNWKAVLKVEEVDRY